MLSRIIELTLRYRWLVLVAILVLLATGGYALYTIPVEAFPDLTNNQVVIVTEAPSLPPTEVEQLVTYPIERGSPALPAKKEVPLFQNPAPPRVPSFLTIPSVCTSPG